MIIASVLSLIQGQGRRHAVRPVATQSGEQLARSRTHAAPGPNSPWQSVSFLQNRHSLEGSFRSVKSAQKPALPLVSVQRQLSLWLHVTPLPTVQVSVSGKQLPLLWATQIDVTGSQIPEQQRAPSPWHGCPTSRQPKALKGGGAWRRWWR